MSGSFVDTRMEAIQKRRKIKSSGRCGCFTKTVQGIYYVSSCSKHHCLPKIRKEMEYGR